MSLHGTLVIRHNPGQPQPWHLRTVYTNGKAGATSETYTTRRNAEDAVCATARCFGFDAPRLSERIDDQRVVYSGGSIRGIALPHEYVIGVVKYEEAP